MTLQDEGRADWLRRAIEETERYVHAMLDDFEQERSLAPFATSDYDFVLLERDWGEQAQQTLAQLRSELAERERGLAAHRARWH